MEDSTAMTIEFLRARLLSERAISKAANEKADQLAKRVMELEEQVRIMAIQRRKTKQAAIEAISILETHGINDLFDAVDSSSNNDENPSGEKRHEETYSGSDARTTAKSVNVGDDFVIIGDDQPELSINASGSQSSFEIIQKQEAGMLGNERDDEMERVLEQQAQLIGQYEAEEKAQREWERKYNENKSSNQAYSEPEKQYHEPEVNCESQKDSFAFFVTIPYEDKEEKSDIGVPSMMKEPECRPADPVHNATDDALGEKLDRNKDAKTLEFSNGYMPPDLPRMGSESSPQTFIHGLIGKVGEHVAVDQVHPSVAVSVPEARLVNNSNIFSHSHTTSSSVGKPSTANSRKEILNLELSKKSLELSRTQAPSCPRPYQQVPGGVLESLQRAKISLKRELHRSPSLGQSTDDLQSTSPYHIQRTISSDSAKLPTGSTGMFRLPNDTFPQVQNAEFKFHGSGFHSAAGYPRLPYATIPCDNHHPNIPYAGAGSSNSIGYHHSAELTDSIRYSLPFSGLTTDRISIPNETGISIRNRFDACSQKINIPPFRRYSLPSTLMTDAKPFPSRSESSVHPYLGPFHRGTEKPPSHGYSLPYSDLTRERITLHGRSRKSRTDARPRVQSQDQFTFNGGNGTQSNMQTL